MKNLFELIEDYQKQFPKEDIMLKLCLFSLNEIEDALKRDGKKIELEESVESIDEIKIVYISPND